MGDKFSVSDVVQSDFFRFPAALLANPQYKEMSCEAKIVYMLLLNRMTLSQRNGWINDAGEVYLIMTREEAAGLLNISYKKMIAVFKELTSKKLICEQRQGRGYPNLIFVLKTILSDKEATEFSDDYNGGSGDETGGEANGAARCDVSAVLDVSYRQVKDCKNDSSRPDKRKVLDVSKRQSSQIYNSYIENSEIEKRYFDGQTNRAGAHGDSDDMGVLEDIYDRCELDIYDDPVRLMFENAIERLYYSSHYRIGSATLPQAQIRKHLNQLNAAMVSAAHEALVMNEKPVRNTTAFLMSTLLNSIAEATSDLLACLPPQYLGREGKRAAPSAGRSGFS